MKTSILLALVPALVAALPASSISSVSVSTSIAPSSSPGAVAPTYSRQPHKEEADAALASPKEDHPGSTDHPKGTEGKQDSRPWGKPKNVTEGHDKPNRPPFGSPQNGTHGFGQHNENDGQHDGGETDGKNEGQHNGGNHHGPPGRVGHHGRSDVDDDEPDVEVKMTLWVRLISWLTGKPKAEIVNADAQLQDEGKGRGEGKGHDRGNPDIVCNDDDTDCVPRHVKPDPHFHENKPCNSSSGVHGSAVTLTSVPPGVGPSVTATTTYSPAAPSSTKLSSSSSSHLPRPTGPAGWAHGGPWSPTANLTMAKATSRTSGKPAESALPHASNGGGLQFGHPHGGPKSSLTSSFSPPFPTTHSGPFANSSTPNAGTTSSVSRWAQPSHSGKPIWEEHPNNNHTQILPAPGQPMHPKSSSSMEAPILTNTQPPKPLGATVITTPSSSSSTLSTLAKPTNLPFITNGQPPKPLGPTTIPVPSSSSSTSSSVTKPVVASGHFSPVVITPSGQTTPILPTTTSSSTLKPDFTKDQVGAVPTGPTENEIDEEIDEGDLEG